jgi:hypothetical protein
LSLAFPTGPRPAKSGAESINILSRERFVDPKSPNGSEQRSYLGKASLLSGAKTLTQTSDENITQALNELKHEVLSHQVFLNCFSNAVRRGEIKGLTKSSLFRTTLAYFLLVPDAKQKFLRELEKHIMKKTRAYGKTRISYSRN